MSLARRARENLLATAGLFVVGAAVGMLSLAGLVARAACAALGWGGPVGSTLAALAPVFAVSLLLAVPVTWLSVLGLGYGVGTRAVPRVKATAGTVRLALVDLAADIARFGSAASAWLGRTARRAERDERTGEVPGVSALAEAFDDRSAQDRADDRVQRLTERYLDDEISEVELDRRVEAILDEADIGHAEASALDDRLDALSDRDPEPADSG